MSRAASIERAQGRADVVALRAAGASVREIARVTGLTVSQVKYKLYDVKPVTRPRVSLKTQQRRCMCCGREFASEGPHNRLCGRCGRNSYTDLELFGGD